MEKEKYLIGDVANLLGVSRDTLRYYEKRGILSSEKGDNGYRYYTKQDVSKMISVLYQRKMNIGLDDMELLWNENGTPDKLTEITTMRLEEEEQAIRTHQQTIARLKLTQADCERIQNSLDQIGLETFPTAYTIIPHTTQEESIALWFQYAKDYAGLDMMYTFDEYHWQETGDSLILDYKNTQLVLYEELREVVDYPITTENHTTQPKLCVSSFCISKTRTPDPAQILPLIRWAKKQKLLLSGELFAASAFQGFHEGETVHYLHIYIPVF